MEAARVGAYGLVVAGLEEQRHLLSPAAENWPALRLQWARAGPLHPPASIDTARAVYPLDDGRYVVIDRVAGTATSFGLEPPSLDEMLHPRLGMMAAVYARWLGDEAFHAGAFVHGERTWAVVGEGGDGKSSLLAAAHAAGLPVVTDDTLVIRDGVCLSGARCIDLRDDAAEALEVQDRVVPARGGSRSRLPIGPLARATALGGWLFLGWGDDVALEPVHATARLAMIGGLRRWHRHGVPNPVRLLELAALPGWVLRRPRDWRHTAEVLDLLGSALGSGG